MNFLKNVIYKAIDRENSQYDCYMPTTNFTGYICDCWIVDSNGNIDPDYNVSPVPVHKDNLGEALKTLIEE